MKGISINAIEQESTIEEFSYFKSNVYGIIQDVRHHKLGWCLNKEEFEEVKKRIPKIKHEHPAIVAGEKYDYIWKVWL